MRYLLTIKTKFGKIILKGEVKLEYIKNYYKPFIDGFVCALILHLINRLSFAIDFYSQLSLLSIVITILLSILSTLLIFTFIRKSTPKKIATSALVSLLAFILTVLVIIVLLTTVKLDMFEFIPIREDTNNADGLLAVIYSIIYLGFSLVFRLATYITLSVLNRNKSN